MNPSYRTERALKQTSLDPPKITLRRKVEKLREALLEERRQTMGQLEQSAAAGGQVLLEFLKEIQAWNDGKDKSGPFSSWGEYGPLQGNVDRHLEVMIGRVYEMSAIIEQLDEVLKK